MGTPFGLDSVLEQLFGYKKPEPPKRKGKSHISKGA